MKPKRSSPEKMRFASELRKSPTPAETKLWSYLRKNQLNGVYSRRQHAIGPYIADFCSLHSKLIIELDGSQHLENEEYDINRTAYLEAKGYKVLRFWNSDVLNDLNGVFQAILNELDDSNLA